LADAARTHHRGRTDRTLTGLKGRGAAGNWNWADGAAGVGASRGGISRLCDSAGCLYKGR